MRRSERRDKGLYKVKHQFEMMSGKWKMELLEKE